MRLIWQTVWHDLYRRKRNFILVMAISVIALCLLGNVLIEFSRNNYQIYMVRKLMDKKLDYVRFEIIYNEKLGWSYDDMVADFSSRLKASYPDTYGYFMYVNVEFAEYQGDEEYGQQRVLYVDENTSDLCLLKDMEGNRVSIGQGEREDGMLYVYVGYALRDRLPVGTIITNEYTGSKMYVAGVLEEGSIWISELLLGGEKVSEVLDSYILSPVDEGLLPIYIANGNHSQFVRCNDKDEAQVIMEDIKALANEYDILLYCNTISGWIEEDKLENKEVLDAIGILTAFTVLIAVFAIGAASIADVYSRQYELGIMYIHGVSGLQIFTSVFFENMIKLCIAGGIAIFYSGNHLTGDDMYIHGKFVVPEILAFIIIVGLITTWISYTTIRKRSMTDFTGGAYR